MRFFAGQSNRIPKKMGAFWIFKTDSKGIFQQVAWKAQPS
jgi:hypothetical protein